MPPGSRSRMSLWNDGSHALYSWIPPEMVTSNLGSWVQMGSNRYRAWPSKGAMGTAYLAQWHGASAAMGPNSRCNVPGPSASPLLTAAAAARSASDVTSLKMEPPVVSAASAGKRQNSGRGAAASA